MDNFQLPTSQPPITPQTPVPKKSFGRKYIFVLALILIALALGFFIGKFTSNSTLPSKLGPQAEVAENKLIESNPTTTILGKITRVNGKTLSVTTFKNSGEIESADQVSVIKGADKNGPVVSADLNAVELDKEVILVIQIKNGRYEVTSIIYQPQLSSNPLPPPAQASASAILRSSPKAVVTPKP